MQNCEGNPVKALRTIAKTFVILFRGTGNGLAAVLLLTSLLELLYCHCMHLTQWYEHS